MKKIQDFIDAWTDDALKIKPVFQFFYDELLKRPNVRVEWHERPGISYSLRGINKNQKNRPLFVMIDVIDDEPETRWLSVCFYEDTITDPDELGDVIPEGLLGSDGYCFDITEQDDQIKAYINQRIHEASQN